MSLVFMTEQHTFIQLSNKSEDDAIQAIKQYIGEFPTYGFIGCYGPVNYSFQWKPDYDWEPAVRRLLRVAPADIKKTMEQLETERKAECQPAY